MSAFGKDELFPHNKGEVVVYTSPSKINLNGTGIRRKIFLAGTIDNGSSENWQDKVIELYKQRVERTKFFSGRFDIYNPRRENWDSSVIQSMEDPTFYQQVAWELDAMDKADYILMVFLPDSQSPVTLLELGLYATSKKLKVVCPDEYFRSGNVNFICNKFNIPLYKTIEELEI